MKNSKFLTLLLTLSIGSAVFLWGCGDDDTNPPSPVAGFTFTVDEATGGTVTFSNTSENATNYAWDFGDGNTSTDESPVNTYAANGDYTVELVASNSAGTTNSSSETITIVLAPVAGFSFMIDEATGGTVTFANTSENATSYAWDFGDGNTSTDENPVNTYAANGDYTVELVASNSAGTTNSSSETITISLIPVAGFSYEAVGNTVTFTNTSKNATSYAWDFGDGNTSTDENPVNTYAANGDYTVELVASNDAGATHSFSMAIEITAATTNAAPVFANTSYSFNVASDATDGTVVGTVSAMDTDGDMLIYSLSGTDAGSFAISSNPVASGEEVSVTVATNADLPSLVSPVALAVEVSDGTDQVTANVEITIAVGNVAPVFDQTAYTFTIAEGATDGAILGPVSATDSNAGDLLTYSLSGTDADHFAINNTPVTSGTAVPVTVAASANLSSLTSPVTLIVTATDDETPALMATANVEITIIAGNVAPVFDQTDYTFAVNEDAESGDIVDAVSATDSNAGNLLAYTLSGEGADNFAIDNTAVASGTDVQITVSGTASLDHETTTSYTLEVQASDDASPALTATAEVTINVNNVNDNAPVFTGAPYTFSVNENSVAGTVVDVVAATDADGTAVLSYRMVTTQTDFDIDANTGEMTVGTSATLDFETVDSYTLEVEASDGTNAATAEVTINVNDVNDNDPVFSGAPYTFSVEENSPASTVVGMVSATDADANTTLEYSIVGTQTDFDIDTGTGEITVASAVLDFETTTSYTLEVEASDGTKTATADVTINVDNVNEAPTFTGAPYTFGIDENAQASTMVGTVAATDVDANTTLQYSIVGTQTDFDIDSGTGEMTVASAALDFETTTSYTLEVEASDGASSALTATADVTINVNDLNDEAPVFGATAYTFEIAENLASGEEVGTVAATDADAGATLEYSITNTQTEFDIDANTGIITVSDAATFDHMTLSTYTLMVQVDDDDDTNTAMVEVTITILQPSYDADNDGLIDIKTLEQLNAMRWDLDGNGEVDEATDATAYAAAFPDAAATFATTPTGYELLRDLDFDATDSYGSGVLNTAWSTNTGVGWDPIGNYIDDADNTPYTAAFEGNNYTLSNLYINRNNRVGLFVFIPATATISNVGLVDVDITSIDLTAGGLVALNDGTITGSYITGAVTASTDTGGLVGISREMGFITACYSEATVIAPLANSGGLVGLNHGTITASYATGIATGTNSVGGLLGRNNATGVLTASYATGTATGTNSVGGLVGWNREGATITACYATGAVTGTANVGGLVGANARGSNIGTATPSITACYATGTVTLSSGTSTDIGGLVGFKDSNAEITASYYDSETTDQDDTGKGTGQTTSELKTPTAYDDNTNAADNSSIYETWNADIDDGLTQGIDDATAAGDSTADDPWDFGTSSQYPVLKVDFNGDGTATVAEFGTQPRG